MIVRMAKVLLIGPREKFLEVMTMMQQLGIMHIDPLPATPDSTGIDIEQYLKNLPADQELAGERIFLEKLGQEIKDLLLLLDDREIRPSHISPETALFSLPRLIRSHAEKCAAWSAESDRLRQGLHSISTYLRLLSAVNELIPDPVGFEALEAIGVVIANEEAFSELWTLLKKEVQGYLEFKLLPVQEGESIGLLISEREAAQQLREILESHGVTELVSPEESLAALPFAEKMAAAEQMAAEWNKQLKELERNLAIFARRWGGIYQNLALWIKERLAVLSASTALFETDLCFFLFGWIPETEIPGLAREISAQFGSAVLIEEMQAFVHDIEKIPIALRNPPYFKPFELFSRVLPLPAYSSFDITPFIAVFFPIYFGLMLGDTGYGLILFGLALTLLFRFKEHRNVSDAAKILLVSSAYTMIFGAFYGEFFGEIGHTFFGLHQGLIHRQTALVPMFIFSISLGVVHVIIGLVLGMVSSLKRNLKKEAIFKLFSIIIIFFLLAVVVLFWTKERVILSKPLILILLFIIGVLLLSGGILAPLEVLKHFGNIISYARIMAIGLTSVFLAEVANELAGMMGSIWIGLFVAVLLHAFNIVLGLFAPTIHALRLHYVEFFSKFMEEGGKAFKPFRK